MKNTVLILGKIIFICLVISCNNSAFDNKSINIPLPFETAKQKEMCFVGKWKQMNLEEDSSHWELEASKGILNGLEKELDEYSYRLIHFDKFGRVIVDVGSGFDSGYGRWKIDGSEVLLLSVFGIVQRRLVFTNCNRIVFRNIVFIKQISYSDMNEITDSNSTESFIPQEIEIKATAPEWTANLDRIFLGDYSEVMLAEKPKEKLIAFIGDVYKKPINYAVPFDDFIYITIDKRDYFFRLVESISINGKRKKSYTIENLKITIEYDREAPTLSGAGWGGLFNLYANGKLIKSSRIYMG